MFFIVDHREPEMKPLTQHAWIGVQVVFLYLFLQSQFPRHVF